MHLSLCTNIWWHKHLHNQHEYVNANWIRNLSNQLDLIIYMPPSHRREFCVRTNPNWHSLRIAQHRIDSNYFVLFRCHFISSQANMKCFEMYKTFALALRIEASSYCVVLHRRTSYQFVSVTIGSYLIVVHSYRFVVHSLYWDSPPVCCDSVRCNTMRNDRIVVLDRTCSHWFV